MVLMRNAIGGLPRESWLVLQRARVLLLAVGSLIKRISGPRAMLGICKCPLIEQADGLFFTPPVSPFSASHKILLAVVRRKYPNLWSSVPVCLPTNNLSRIP